MALQPTRMKYVRSTKNFHVYEAADGSYAGVKKSAFLDIKPPEFIVIQVAIAPHAASVAEVK